MERTLVLLKPDTIQRCLTGRIIQRFEDKGLKLVAMKMTMVTQQQAMRLYECHAGKDFYEPLVEYMTSSPIIAIVLSGIEAIQISRNLAGKTFGPDASAGTIRGDYGSSRRYNLVHASDSEDSVQRELSVFFEEGEILDYDRPVDKYVIASIDRELYQNK